MHMPVERLVAYELRNCAGLAKQRVDELRGVVPASSQQVAKHRPQRAYGVKLGLIVGPAAREGEGGVPLVEVIDSSQSVRRLGAVHQGHGRLQRHHSVMSENHFDRLPQPLYCHEP